MKLWTRLSFEGGPGEGGQTQGAGGEPPPNSPPPPPPEDEDNGDNEGN